jgi:hypothetical protein
LGAFGVAFGRARCRFYSLLFCYFFLSRQYDDAASKKEKFRGSERFCPSLRRGPSPCRTRPLDSAFHRG